LHAKTIKSYGQAEMPILLKNDSTGLVLQVPDEKPPAAQGGATGQAPAAP